MKMTPLAQGTGTPSQDIGGAGVSQDARARAIAAAQGQKIEAPPPGQEPSSQVDKIKTIKMKTQVSTNRHELASAVEPNPEPTVEPSSSSNTNEVAPKVEETKPLDPQLAVLAKARRALQLDKAAFEKEKADFEAQKSNPNQFADYVSKADLKERRLQVLLDNGITYDQLTEDILSGNGANPDVAALKQRVESVEKSFAEQLAKRDELQEQQVLNQIQIDTDRLITGNDKYAAIKLKPGANKDVVRLIHKTWKQQGELLDVETAADLVEKQIRDEEMPLVDLLRPQPKETPVQVETQQQLIPRTNVKVMKTLTNRDTANIGAQDRRSRAIAAFYGRK